MSHIENTCFQPSIIAKAISTEYLTDSNSQVFSNSEINEQENVFIQIKNTGPGIKPEDHASLFELFKRIQDGLRVKLTKERLLK